MNNIDKSENLNSYFNMIKLTKPIPEDQRLNEKEYDEKIKEQLPYFFMWLIKSQPIKIV